MLIEQSLSFLLLCSLLNKDSNVMVVLTGMKNSISAKMTEALRSGGMKKSTLTCPSRSQSENMWKEKSKRVGEYFKKLRSYL